MLLASAAPVRSQAGAEVEVLQNLSIKIGSVKAGTDASVYVYCTMYTYGSGTEMIASAPNVTGLVNTRMQRFRFILGQCALGQSFTVRTVDIMNVF